MAADARRTRWSRAAVGDDRAGLMAALCCKVDLRSCSGSSRLQKKQESNHLQEVNHLHRHQHKSQRNNENIISN